MEPARMAGKVARHWNSAIADEQVLPRSAYLANRTTKGHREKRREHCLEQEHGEGHVRGAEAGAANGANAGKEGEQALLAGVGWAK